jgi:hypothetical protein
VSDFIEITTPIDGLTHRIPLANGTPDYAGINSPNTIAALTEAYLDGNWEPYTPPEPIALPPEPNPAAFRAALAQAPSWLAWAETLSSVAYTNLTIAAAQGNWPEAQAIYNAIQSSTPPEPDSIAEWQGLADTNGIPINF